MSEQQKSFDLNNDPYKNGINVVKVENIFAKLKQRGGYDVTRLANTMISRGDPRFEKIVASLAPKEVGAVH